MQKNAKKIRKFSIKEAESLISAIRALSRETEEELCKRLKYNEGYISQLRSREASSKEHQVSEKFMQQLRNDLATLQKATTPVSLDEVLKVLSRLENGQTYIRAEVRGWGQYQLLNSVNWNQEAFLKEWVKVGKLIGANIQVDGELGTIRPDGS